MGTKKLINMSNDFQNCLDVNKEYKTLKTTDFATVNELTDFLNVQSEQGWKLLSPEKLNGDFLMLQRRKPSIPEKEVSLFDFFNIHGRGVKQNLEKICLQAKDTERTFIQKVVQETMKFAESEGIKFLPDASTGLEEMFYGYYMEKIFLAPLGFYDKILNSTTYDSVIGSRWRIYFAAIKTMMESIPVSPDYKVQVDYIVKETDILLKQFYTDEDLTEEDGMKQLRYNIRNVNSELKSPEAELVGGTLSMIRSSSILWYDEFDNIVKVNYGGDIVPNLIQADAFGYILGWLGALRSDYLSGGVTPDGQNRRIDAGFNGALAWSSAGAFGALANRLWNNEPPVPEPNTIAIDEDSCFVPFVKLSFQ